jgi:hypothetical protein
LEDSCGLVLFDSTSQALKAERALKAGGVKCAVIPTPVEFTSGCGIALVVEGDSIEDAKPVLVGCVDHRFVVPYLRKQR